MAILSFLVRRLEVVVVCHARCGRVEEAATASTDGPSHTHTALRPFGDGNV